MASMRDIRRRIKSVASTAKITKAMQMVAAVKMRRSQQAALNGRPYAVTLHNMLVSSTLSCRRWGSLSLTLKAPYSAGSGDSVTTDKGLCGGLNTNLIREACKFDPANTIFITAGRKALSVYSPYQTQTSWRIFVPGYSAVFRSKSDCKMAVSLLPERRGWQISILFPTFKNTMTQTPTCVPLLPITELKPIGGAKKLNYKRVIVYLLPSMVTWFWAFSQGSFMTACFHYMNTLIYHVLLETRACEFSARMVSAWRTPLITPTALLSSQFTITS